MKFNVVSDLHLGPDFSIRNLNFSKDVENLIVAGDLSNGIGLLERFVTEVYSEYGVQTIFVPGNHDFYGHSFERYLEEARDLEMRLSNFKFLYNDFLQLGDVKIFGATLWSDFGLYRDVPGMFQHMIDAYGFLIADDRYMTGWSVYRMLEENKITMDKLVDFAYDIDDSFKKVVITHFAPSRLSVHPNYKEDIPMNSYWVNGYDDIIETSNISLWIHGHCHNSFDYDLNGTRVVCNPCGYSSFYSGTENSLYDPKLIVEI